MALLAQFLLRLTFGLAVGLAIPSSRQVTSGYFRNHLYVTLGLSTLAALVSFSVALSVAWYAVAAAVASYSGSVCWLYEKANLGKCLLWVVAAISLAGALNLYSLAPGPDESNEFLNKYFPAVERQITAEEATTMEGDARRMGFLSGALSLVSIPSSGLLMGITLATMLLGHWYLNSPTMDLAPLQRMMLAMAVAVAVQTVVSALGLACELRYSTELSTAWLLFLVLRWSFGLFGVAVLVWMAWQTLKIPNTQSATGILYVAVIGVFVGELTGLLLSAESAFPL